MKDSIYDKYSICEKKALNRGNFKLKGAEYGGADIQQEKCTCKCISGILCFLVHAHGRLIPGLSSLQTTIESGSVADPDSLGSAYHFAQF
jgi:hypothetical protein